MFNDQAATWDLAEPQTELIHSLQHQFNMNEVLARLLINRGIESAVQAQAFLHSGYENLLDPFQLKDMQKSVQRIAQAIERQEKIVVYGDYDVDGITASALLVQVLKELGATAEYYIPERFTEGYGLNAEALHELAEAGYTLLVSVDCGISSQAEVAGVPSHFDVIITDHHEPPEELPRAYAIINPKQSDCSYGEKNLAGVGLAFKLCQALWQFLRPQDEGRLKEFTQLAALGTVADMAPLKGENRVLVKLGLEAMNQAALVGIKALLTIAGVKEKAISAQTIGFILGPRLNASGRLSHARKAVELLITQDEFLARNIAQELDAENSKRQIWTRQIFNEADRWLQEQGKTEDPVLLAWGSWDSQTEQGWHPGVIGIVASRLMEKYYRPVVLISFENHVGKGSCRSIPSFHIYQALQACSSYLAKFGGHPAAAGLTIDKSQIHQFESTLLEYARNCLTEPDLIRHIPIDAVVALEEIDDALLESLAVLEPCGRDNAPPVLACREAAVTGIRKIGQTGEHVKVTLKGSSQACLPVVAFGRGQDTPWLEQQDQVDIAFTAEYNEWKGQKNIQLLCRDWRPAQSSSKALDRLFQENQEDQDRYEQIEEAESFYTKLVGVTFANRQELIGNLGPGAGLNLVREPNNPADPQAIQVCTGDNQVLGYLNHELACHLAPVMDQGRHYQGIVTDITGQTQQTLGVNVQIVQQKFAAAQLDRPALKPGETWDDLIRQQLLGGYAYHEVQQQALQALARGENTLVIMGTGRGKSAIFQTHAAKLALEKGQMTIVIYPLRALVNDQYQNLSEKLAPLGITVAKGNGTLSDAEKAGLFQDLEQGKIAVLLATPEFIAAHQTKFWGLQQQIGLFVVDECHHIAMSGKRQRPVYQRIGQLLQHLGDPLTLAVTATADEKTFSVLKKVLPLKTVLIDPTIRHNLALTDGRNETDKFEYLIQIAKQQQKVLIYVNSRKKAYELAQQLRARLPRCRDQIGFYHGGLNNLWRQEVEKWFRQGVVQVLVATSAFGEGIDLPNIRHVVLYHLPFHKTGFNQQCGRAGRDGQDSTIHVLFNQRDVDLNQFILSNRALERPQIAALYITLKQEAANHGVISLSNAELAQRLEQLYHVSLAEEGVSLGLRILEELNLVRRDRQGRRREIVLMPQPEQKQSLTQSVTYLEGLREAEDFLHFAQEVMQASSDRLLSWINQPVYPQKVADA